MPLHLWERSTPLRIFWKVLQDTGKSILSEQPYLDLEPSLVTYDLMPFRQLLYLSGPQFPHLQSGVNDAPLGGL